MTVSALNPEACWLISTTTGGGIKASRLLGPPCIFCKVWPKRKESLFYYLRGGKTWKNELNSFSDISKSIQKLHLSQESCGKPEICPEKLHYALHLYLYFYVCEQIHLQRTPFPVMQIPSVASVRAPCTLQNPGWLWLQPLLMGTLRCGTPAGELLMQAGLGFEHTPPYCYSDSRQRVYIVLGKKKKVVG